MQGGTVPQRRRRKREQFKRGRSMTAMQLKYSPMQPQQRILWSPLRGNVQVRLRFIITPKLHEYSGTIDPRTHVCRAAFDHLTPED